MLDQAIEILPHDSHRDDYYTAMLDGSDYFYSTKVQGPGCLQRRDTGGEVHFRHPLVSATLVKAGSHMWVGHLGVS